MPGTLNKQPWEEKFLEIDVTKAMAQNDSLASVNSINIFDGTSDVSATMISGSPTLQGNYIDQKVIAGTDDKTYVARVRITTTQGEKLQDDFKVKVKEKTY